MLSSHCPGYKFDITCLNISSCVHVCECVCVHARVPPRSQRLGWVCTDSCAQQLPTAASDRHSNALISWPVTIHTHSCALLREQAEHRQGLQGAGKANSGSTDTDENIQGSCHCLQDQWGRLILFCLRGHPAALHISLWLHWDFFLNHSSVNFCYLMVAAQFRH